MFIYLSMIFKCIVVIRTSENVPRFPWCGMIHAGHSRVHLIFLEPLRQCVFYTDTYLFHVEAPRTTLMYESQKKVILNIWLVGSISDNLVQIPHQLRF